MIFSKKRKLFLAFSWLIFISILFFMPGSEVHEESWLRKIPHVDKLVHMGFFLVLMFLWLWVYKDRRLMLLLLIIAIAYGYGVEVIQRDFIKGRDYDLYDWLADSIGAVIGFLYWRVYKKIDPCRNRGRNQN